MRDKIKKLFELIDADKAFVCGMDMLLDSIVVAAGQQEPELVEKVVQRSRDIVAAEAPNVNDKLAALYEETYNEEEIDAMIAWHSSPVGRKIAAMTPSIMTASAAIGAEVGNKINAEIARIVLEFENAAA